MLNPRLSRQTPTWRARAMVLGALVGIVLPTASFDLSAQSAGPRALTGYVYDSSGSVLPAVDVTLINEWDVGWSTVTDSRGGFEFAPVGAGTHVLEVTLPGFRTLRNAFTLERVSDWHRNITMLRQGRGGRRASVGVQPHAPEWSPRPGADDGVREVQPGGLGRPPRHR